MIRTLAALLCLLLARPAAADPALFIARAPGATIYILGSIALLTADAKWETPAIDTAFDTADQRWFPTDFAAPGRAENVRKYAYVNPPELPALLAPAELDALRQKIPAVDGMRPWLVTATVTREKLHEAGFNEALGPDYVLQIRARIHSLPITALETPDQLYRRYAELPAPVAVDLLRRGLANLDAVAADAETHARLWLTGDIEGIGHEFAASKRYPPGSLEPIVQEPNRRWAARLVALRGTGAKVFVVVDIVHLVGPANLRDLLGQAGFTIERVQ